MVLTRGTTRIWGIAIIVGVMLGIAMATWRGSFAADQAHEPPGLPNPFGQDQLIACVLVDPGVSFVTSSASYFESKLSDVRASRLWADVQPSRPPVVFVDACSAPNPLSIPDADPDHPRWGALRVDEPSPNALFFRILPDERVNELNERGRYWPVAFACEGEADLFCVAQAWVIYLTESEAASPRLATSALSYALGVVNHEQGELVNRGIFGVDLAKGVDVEP